MDHFTRSLLRPEHVIDADAGVKGPKGVDQAALDKLASAASVILAGKKLQEVKPPPAPRPRERLPFKAKEDLESDAESSTSNPGEGSRGGFPTVLSDRFEEQGNWGSALEPDLFQVVLRYAMGRG
mmetsp:Transcript_17000/g.40283  ORF Transcript_17000/g.40283 Transcript_17000/m.40283 type:complete len:125 (-) Transcript_17000:123-497(-)|eukprot:CAMPEP_0181486506 /NCGR_PEP_ID=MMETSP1110-20121109/47209_1 /TAXON_ID=174948 /ORGANISM="Symbiodinium sp., Strain CCMP421" /LENGTH=124 /DNA_ID=CAMNT_0023612725 /DNA_START=67 /DNA_END=441 /DNA_ORIENTATION=+